MGEVSKMHLSITLLLVSSLCFGFLITQANGRHGLIETKDREITEDGSVKMAGSDDYVKKATSGSDYVDNIRRHGANLVCDCSPCPPGANIPDMTRNVC